MRSRFRGSGMAAFRASNNPIRRSASRSNRRPASEVIDPPDSSATSFRRVVRVNGMGFRVHGVIAVALGAE